MGLAGRNDGYFSITDACIKHRMPPSFKKGKKKHLPFFPKGQSLPGFECPEDEGGLRQAGANGGWGVGCSRRGGGCLLAKCFVQENVSPAGGRAAVLNVPLPSPPPLSC